MGLGGTKNNPYYDQILGKPQPSKKGDPTKPNLGHLVSTGIQAAGQVLGDTPYDQRIGMEQPSLMKRMTDTTFATMGSTFGPMGTLAGGVIDFGKNLVGFMTDKGQFRDARKAADLNDDLRYRNLQPDYTGMARYGTKVKQQMAFGGQTAPVTMEDNETIVMPTQQGYMMVGQTSNNAPSHEQGGVTKELPVGSLVFPEKYKEPVEQALATGNNQAMDAMANSMMLESELAAKQGKPFSNPTMGYMRDGGRVQDNTYTPQGQQLPVQPNMTLQMPQRMMPTTANVGQGAPMVSRPIDYENDVFTTRAERDPSLHNNQFSQMPGYGTPMTSPVEKQTGQDELNTLKQDIAQGKVTKENKDTYVNRLATAQRLAESNPSLMKDYEEVNAYFQGLAGQSSSTPSATTSTGATTRTDEPMATSTASPSTPATSTGYMNPAASTNVNQEDRMATRHMAMRGGVYWSSDDKESRVPLTYWDKDTSTRRFNAEGAKKYGVESGTNIVDVLGNPRKQQPTSTTTSSNQPASAAKPQDNAPSTPSTTPQVQQDTATTERPLYSEDILPAGYYNFNTKKQQEDEFMDVKPAPQEVKPQAPSFWKGMLGYFAPGLSGVLNTQTPSTTSPINERAKDYQVLGVNRENANLATIGRIEQQAVDANKQLFMENVKGATEQQAKAFSMFALQHGGKPLDQIIQLFLNQQ